MTIQGSRRLKLPPVSHNEVSSVEKNMIMDKITSFFINIDNNSLDTGQVLTNSLITNFTFLGLLFILGLSVIGVIINAFLLYIKGFVLGFSISSIIATYKLKVVVAAFIYVFPHQLLNILFVILLSIYSIMLSLTIVSQTIKKKNLNLRKFFKRYLFILVVCVIITFVSSGIETFVTPYIMRFITKWFI